MNVQLILNSKTPFECLQQVLKTFKEAFKNIARLTIFVVNRYLQSYVFKNMGRYKRFYKSVPINKKQAVYGIFDDAKEFCEPCFTTVA